MIYEYVDLIGEILQKGVVVVTSVRVHATYDQIYECGRSKRSMEGSVSDGVLYFLPSSMGKGVYVCISNIFILVLKFSFVKRLFDNNYNRDRCYTMCHDFNFHTEQIQIFV